MARFKIRPDDDSFYGFFNAAAANLLRGANMLLELALPDADLPDLAERLGQLEHDTDRITHEVYNRVNTTSSARPSCNTRIAVV